MDARYGALVGRDPADQRQAAVISIPVKAELGAVVEVRRVEELDRRQAGSAREELAHADGHERVELTRFERLVDADELDAWAASASVGPDPSGLADDWHAMVDDAFAEATLTKPESGWMDGGGKQGRHTEHLGYLLADMQFLQRAYPGASW